MLKNHDQVKARFPKGDMGALLLTNRITNDELLLQVCVSSAVVKVQFFLLLCFLLVFCFFFFFCSFSSLIVYTGHCLHGKQLSGKHAVL